MINKLLENIKDENGNYLAARLRESYVQKTFPEELKIINEYVSHITDNLSFSEKLWLYLNGKKEKPKCLVCDGPVKWFSFGQGGYLKTCSNKCRIQCDEFKEKQKQTLLNTYGVTNPSQSKKIQETIKQNNLKKYGVENTSQLQIIKDKIKTTNIEKYGTIAPIQNESIKEKTKNTIKEKYGVEHTFQSEEIKEKITKTNIEKYGVSNVAKNEEIKNKFLNSLHQFNFDQLLNKYKNFNIIDYKDRKLFIQCELKNHIYEIDVANFRQRALYFKIENPCTICNPIDQHASISENELYDFIENLNKNVLKNDRSIGLELDCYIPSLKLAFEYNGVYWHSEKFKEKYYHINKKIHAHNNDINLIQIWEDDWKIKKDIIKSRIRNLLRMTENKIYARECIIKTVSQQEYKNFVEINHIQGYVSAKYIFGLYHKDVLVSLMSFGSPRKSTGKLNKEGMFELLRNCSILNCNVLGSSQKLFKHFIQEIKPKYIYSYADLCWSKMEGSVYDQLGFKHYKRTEPNYWWVKNGIKYHRFNFIKQRLIKEGWGTIDQTETEIMHIKGYYRLFDCGSNLYVYECK